MNHHPARPWLVILAVIAVIGVNMAAVLLPLNGLSTKELADRYDVLFVPAGYVFSIWSFIYLGLLAFAAYQALPARRRDPVLAGITAPFLGSCAANAAWIFLWHYEQVVASLAAMLALLAALIAVYRRLGIGRREVAAGERWAVHAVFSGYLGWVSVATIVNVAVVLHAVGWSGWGLSDVAWTALLLAVGVALAATVAARRAPGSPVPLPEPGDV